MTTPVVVLTVLSIAVAPHGPLAAALMALSITAVGAVGALVSVTRRGDPTTRPVPPDEAVRPSEPG